VHETTPRIKSHHLPVQIPTMRVARHKVPMKITKMIIPQTSQPGISGNGSAISHFRSVTLRQNYFNCSKWSMKINPSTFPGLKPGVCLGLILSGAFHSVLKDGVWRRRSINFLDDALPATALPICSSSS
jgi:hypothetical protein